MTEERKKGRFEDWKPKDWCIYAGFVLLCLSLFYGAWQFARTGDYLIGFLFAACAMPLLLLCLTPLFSNPAPENKPCTLARVPLPETKEGFLELAKSLGARDEGVLAEVSECLTDPERFLEKAAKEASTDGDDDFYETLSAEYEEHESCSKISGGPFLQGALALLDHRQIVARFDWKADRETLVFFTNKLAMVRINGLTIDGDALPESNGAEQFCEQLDELWGKAGYRTVLIDNDSDEYIVGVQKK